MDDNDLKLLQRLADCGGMGVAFLELKRDAERYRWLVPRLLAADFDYGGEGIQALVFEMPTGFSASADCDATIDDAMAAVWAPLERVVGRCNK
jgi:hypothetical protein